MSEQIFPNRKPNLWKEMRKDTAALAILASVSLMAGLLINAVRDKSLPLIYQSKTERLAKAVEKIAAGESKPSVPLREKLPETMSLEEFRSFVESKQGLVLDARAEIFHRLGHVPGALSLPREDFENGYMALKGKLEEDRGLPIAIYCSSSSCEDGSLLRKALTSLGYHNTAIFVGGWAAWTQAGLPEEKKL